MKVIGSLRVFLRRVPAVWLWPVTALDVCWRLCAMALVALTALSALAVTGTFIYAALIVGYIFGALWHCFNVGFDRAEGMPDALTDAGKVATKAINRLAGRKS